MTRRDFFLSFSLSHTHMCTGGGEKLQGFQYCSDEKIGFLIKISEILIATELSVKEAESCM